MKHIKHFEYKLYHQDVYWLVPTDERGIPALNSIGCDKYEYLKYTLRIGDDLPKYVYISYNHKDEDWGWMPYDDPETLEWFNGNNYRFMGTINIPDYELTTYKYNL